MHLEAAEELGLVDNGEGRRILLGFGHQGLNIGVHAGQHWPNCFPSMGLSFLLCKTCSIYLGLAKGELLQINRKAVEKVGSGTREQGFLAFVSQQLKVSWLEVCHPRIFPDLSLSVAAQPVHPLCRRCFPWREAG